MNKEKLNEAINILKNNGIRITPQRHAILTYLYQTNSHPTADEIYKSLEEKFPNMSVATVYNNLRVFKEANLIQELSFGDNSSRFEINISKHYHIICKKCGRIEDFSYPCIMDIEKIAEEKTRYKIDSHCVEVYGFCQDCQDTIETNSKK
ncbi:Fur family transcriptional regulator [Tepidibacillus sp. LV47]|uniref:Fur family transcriptional regulator n=1 Tax=Tepidibacillus sp. LV47 TaxID=3398228 RepID=UPI003AAB24CE